MGRVAWGGWDGGVLVWLFFLVVAGLVLGLARTGLAAGAIHPDEVVLFYPAMAKPAGAGWQVEARGIVYEGGDHPRQAAVAGRLLGLDVEDFTEDEQRIFARRIAPFLVDHERGKRVELAVGGAKIRFGRSGPNGHFEGNFRWSPTMVPTGAVTLTGTLAASGGLARPIELTVHLLSEEGWSVISDLDDTIKVSRVGDKRALIRGTFCRPFEVVPAMAEAYQRWARAGAQFHYLSASPWQLYPALKEFLDTNGFPAGTFHLKQFRLKDSSALAVLGSQTRYKTEAIGSLLKRWPRRQFVLVGDSGEQDPEIYGEIARSHPGRIRRVYIRNVTGQGPDDPRYVRSFRGLDARQWSIFAETVDGPKVLHE